MLAIFVAVLVTTGVLDDGGGRVVEPREMLEFEFALFSKLSKLERSTAGVAGFTLEVSVG